MPTPTIQLTDDAIGGLFPPPTLMAPIGPQSVKLGRKPPTKDMARVPKRAAYLDAGKATITLPDVVDYYTKAGDNTGASDAPFAVQQGSTAGNISTLFVRKAAIHDDIGQSDSDGVAMLTVPFMALPSDAGNDEVRLVFC